MNNQEINVNHRKYLFITLNHIERPDRQKYTFEVVSQIFQNLFDCKHIIISKEKHGDGGSHYHIGVYNTNASRHTFISKIRSQFPEFEGCQIYIEARKSWAIIYDYVQKDVKGKITKYNYYEWISNDSENVNGVKSANDKLQLQQSTTIIKQLINKKKLSRNELDFLMLNISNWEDFSSIPSIRAKLLYRYKSIKLLFEEIHRNKPILGPREQLLVFLEHHNQLETLPYTPQQIGSTFHAIQFMCKSFVEPRRFKQKQLFLIGGAKTHKDEFLNIIQNIFVCYVGSEKPFDFSNVTTNCHLWCINHFNPNSWKTETLLKVLDGSKLILDRKLDTPFFKQKNVLVVLSADRIPSELDPQINFEFLENKSSHNSLKRKKEAFLERIEILEIKKKNTLCAFRIAQTFLSIIESFLALHSLQSHPLLLPEIPLTYMKKKIL